MDLNVRRRLQTKLDVTCEQECFCSVLWQGLTIALMESKTSENRGFATNDFSYCEGK